MQQDGNGGAGEGAGTSGGPNALDVEVVAERWMKQWTLLARLDLNDSEVLWVPQGFFAHLVVTLFILEGNYLVVCSPDYTVSSAEEEILSYRILPWITNAFITFNGSGGFLLECQLEKFGSYAPL